MTVEQPEFALPFRKVFEVDAALLALARDPRRLPDGRWWIGPAGTYTEEISIALPEFAVAAGAHVSEKRDFAAFSAHEVSEGGKFTSRGGSRLRKQPSRYAPPARTRTGPC